MSALAPADTFTLRAATPDDCEAIFRLIAALAEYEKLTHLVEATPAKLAEALFGARPQAEAVLVEAATAAGGKAIVGYAIFFPNFSTFLARPGLYLEDLYVDPAWRGHGLGKRLLKHLAALAVERGYARFEWSVLDWNTPSIEFYRAMGADVMPDWRICRVTGPALAKLGQPG